VQAEADKLAARLPEWAYELPGYRATNLEMRLDGLLKPLEPAPAPGETTPPDDPGDDGHDGHGHDDPPPDDDGGGGGDEEGGR
jgi:hypothetical protein